MCGAASKPVAEDPELIRWKGLVSRRPRWGPTRRGWAVLLFLILIGAAAILRGIHPFLAPTAPAHAEVLVVEGWVPDYALEAAVVELNAKEYRKLYVTGVPIALGAPLSEYKTYAALGAAVLERLGVTTNRLQSVPTSDVRRDRTYASALALRDWMEAHNELPTSLNLLTLGPHARRSRLLYEKAFGNECEIGVISIENEMYDPRRWWAYSDGVRDVMSETVAYLYARTVFWLSEDRRAEREQGEEVKGPTP